MKTRKRLWKEIKAVGIIWIVLFLIYHSRDVANISFSLNAVYAVSLTTIVVYIMYLIYRYFKNRENRKHPK